MHYESSYFSSDVNAEKIDSIGHDEKMKIWDDDDQCQLHQEALISMVFSGKEVDEFCFKAEHISMQRGIKLHSSKGKDSVMKEMNNLTIQIIVLER